jgi:3-methyl-2-oxobutanoate hydroxymethyltransferase
MMMSIHRAPQMTTGISTPESPPPQAKESYMPKTINVHTLRRFKNLDQKFAMLTCYDYSTAKLLDDAGIETLLVGDSLAMTVLGHPNTLSITVEEMLHHVKAVRRGTQRALVIADMPFGSYHESVEQAVCNASRFIKEGGADVVKIEGATPLTLQIIERLVDMGIPVLGHLGLTPQSMLTLGGFRLQAKTAYEAHKTLLDAQALENAGVMGIVLEMVPNEVAAMITDRVDVPTVGIGAGASCDAQVLVIDDILGRYSGVAPKFVRHYAPVGETTQSAATAYREDILSGSFPDETLEATPMDAGELALLRDLLNA